MRSRLFWFGIVVVALAVFLFAIVPARAQNDMAEQIKELKSKLAELEQQQIEMKKEATEAAAALPNFSYRPGSGLLIEAADKSWSFRASMESHFRLLFESGEVEAGRETGGIMGRRFRPWFYYCVNDCLYEIETGIDLDGFGTGSAKNATGDEPGSILQRGVLWVHFEKLNPWLPTFYTGMEGPAAISSYRRGSSATAAQREYDLLTRNTGFNTGRWGNGAGLNWDDRPLSGIGIPGRMSRLNVVYATIGEGDDGRQSFRIPRSTSAYINIEPFSQLKNKWLRGLGLEFGAWFCPNTANNDAQNEPDVACDRLRIRDHGDGGRQTLFDTGSGSVGQGLTHLLVPGISWTIGPYRLRVAGAFQRYDEDDGGTPGHKKGNMFLIGHDLYVWSPKGFLTGSASTPGSILLGTHFERTDVSCGISNCAAGGEFSRNRILLREFDIWYVLMNRMSIGASWLWYDASNLRTGLDEAQHNLGCSSGSGSRGKGCDWLDFSITWRYQF